jgi:predicted permease
MNAFLIDLRHAARPLIRNVRFVAVSVLVLAIGVGVNTAVFAIVNTLFYAPLTASAPRELRFIFAVSKDARSPEWLSLHDYNTVKREQTAFTGVLAHSRDTALLRSVEAVDDEQLLGEMVSANYFEMLGVRPLLGRTFGEPEQALEATDPVVVIGHVVWQRRFNADSQVVGRRMRLDDREYTIIGVMPAEFRGTVHAWENAQYWVPAIQRRQDYECNLPNFRTRGIFSVIGRLKPGSSDAQAASAIDAIARTLQPTVSPDDASWSLSVSASQPGAMSIGSSATVMPAQLTVALFGVSGAVLLVAVVNLSGILVANVVRRRSELAIRIALGASRWHVARLLIAEAVLLGLLGGALAFLVARLLLKTFVVLATRGFPANVAVPTISLDYSSFVFTIALAVIAGVAAVLASLLDVFADRTSHLLTGDLTTPSRGTAVRMRYLIVVPQISVSCMLMIGAALALRIVLRAQLADHGYVSRGVSFVSIELPSIPLCERSMDAVSRFIRQRREFNRRVFQAAGTLPTVKTVALTNGLPFDNFIASITPRHVRDPLFHKVSALDVSPGYFETLGIPLLSGRDFSIRDAPAAPDVGIVSESLAKMLWPTRSPIGEYFGFGVPGQPQIAKWVQVVGIVGDIRLPFAETSSRPTVYVPLAQGSYGRAVIARGFGSEAETINSIRQTVRQLNAKARIMRSGTIVSEIDTMLFPQRVAAAILLIAGALAIALASAGLYAIVSYTVAQRIREVGIRAALGAQRRDVVRLLMLDGMSCLALGFGCGLIASAMLIRTLASAFVRLPQLDAAIAAVVLMALALPLSLACYMPARGAADIDPSQSLRVL